MATLKITQDKHKRLKFALLDDLGEQLFASEAFDTKPLCLSAIPAVRINAPYDSRYERLLSVDRKCYFTRKDNRGSIIGTSKFFQSVFGQKYGISVLKREGQ